eukprot:CAMPEP_0185608738 /NCGR_PEP_ID=MMETSP0436-20130131/8201_1 /TAXON_ID=626734 ORGANISM="Favella taraikaensis, Strain Fe Narragansett Bay" /NCGR_SAMPLE_ID=MMETSP0436 /ASSEMBLY_ACC=CAM_ASM_000390 /LENGTH=65 /DNA_ID=CAMNT_0028240999 /DNA_START=30 /DNA_END=227 /DNA_ORIENTATION=-
MIEPEKADGSQGGDGDDNDQMQAIQEKKSALARQLIVYILMSALISAAFYGITITQNPDLLPTRQ